MAQRPVLFGARASAQLLRMAETEEYPTLEEELEAGRITQEEYDELNGGISEEQYLAVHDKVQICTVLYKHEGIYRSARVSKGLHPAGYKGINKSADASTKEFI